MLSLVDSSDGDTRRTGGGIRIKWPSFFEAFGRIHLGLEAFLGFQWSHFWIIQQDQGHNMCSRWKNSPSPKAAG